MHLGPPRIKVSSLRKDEASCANIGVCEIESTGVGMAWGVDFQSCEVAEGKKGYHCRSAKYSQRLFSFGCVDTRNVSCAPEVWRAETNRWVKSAGGTKPSAQLIDRHLNPALMSFNKSSQSKLSSTWAKRHFNDGNMFDAPGSAKFEFSERDPQHSKV
jgi:hypothetical protein